MIDFHCDVWHLCRVSKRILKEVKENWLFIFFFFYILFLLAFAILIFLRYVLLKQFHSHHWQHCKIICLAHLNKSEISAAVKNVACACQT